MNYAAPQSDPAMPAARPGQGDYPPADFASSQAYVQAQFSAREAAAAYDAAMVGYPGSGSAPSVTGSTTYDMSAGMATPAPNTLTAAQEPPPRVNGSRMPNPRASRKQASSKGPRRAKLQLRHIDPWSMLKLSLILAIALFFVWMVAVGVLYGVLSGMGVFEKVNGLWGDLQGSQGDDLVTPKLVFGGAALIGAINVVLFTALATVGAFVYNLCADLVGGLEITLSERR